MSNAQCRTILPHLASNNESPASRVNPLSNRSDGKPSPRRSDIGFIVKHLPLAVDPETACRGKHMLQPREGGRAGPRNLTRPTMKPQRVRIALAEEEAMDLR
jgi:hypothetical protein